MTDTISPQTRSRVMSAVRGKNTRPELLLRRRLHKAGYRYRLHVKGLPGKPDLVFPRRRSVIFVNGCFWHCHECHRFSWPKTRESFWRAKILGNKERDGRNHTELLLAGWRVGVVWQCALVGRGSLGIDAVAAECERWLDSTEQTLSVSGRLAISDTDGDPK